MAKIEGFTPLFTPEMMDTGPKSDLGKEAAAGWASYKAGLQHIASALGSEKAAEWAQENEDRAALLRSRSNAPHSWGEVQIGDSDKGLLNYIGQLGASSLPYLAEVPLYVAADVATGGALTPAIATRLATAAAPRIAAKAVAEKGLEQTARGLARTAMVPAVTYPSSLGDILANQYEESGKYNLPAAAALAAPYAASNLLGLEGVAARGLPKSTLASRTGRGLVTGLESAAGEMVNETFQEVMNQAGRMAVNPEASLTSPEALERYKEAAIGGGLLGFVGGGVGGAMSRNPRLDPTNKVDPQNLLGTANQMELPLGNGGVNPVASPLGTPSSDLQNTRESLMTQFTNTQDPYVKRYLADRINTIDRILAQPQQGQMEMQLDNVNRMVETRPETMTQVGNGLVYNPVTGVYQEQDTVTPLGRTPRPAAAPIQGPLSMVGAGAPDVNINQGILPGMEMPLTQQALAQRTAPVVTEIGPEQGVLLGTKGEPTYQAAAPTVTDLSAAYLKEAGVNPTPKRVAVLEQALMADLPQDDLDQILTALAESKLGVAQKLVDKGVANATSQIQQQASVSTEPQGGVEVGQATEAGISDSLLGTGESQGKTKGKRKKVSELAANLPVSPADVKAAKVKTAELINTLETTKDVDAYKEAHYALWKRWADGDAKAEKYFEENPLTKQERADMIVRERKENASAPDDTVFKASDQVSNVANPDKDIAAKYALPEGLVKEGTTGAQMLDWLIKNALDKDHKDIARRIAARVDLSNVPIKALVEGDKISAAVARAFNLEGALGVTAYNEEDGIRIYLHGTKGMEQITLLHELIHAAVNLKLSDPKVAAEFTRLMNLVSRGLNADISNRPEVKFLQEVGAFKDVREFVAYYFSSPTLQKYLETLAADGKPINLLRKRGEEAKLYKTKEQVVPERPVYTLGQKIKDFISSLFGFTKKYEKAYMDAVNQRQVIIDSNANRKMYMLREKMDEALDNLLAQKDVKGVEGLTAATGEVAAKAKDLGKEVLYNTVGKIKRLAKNMMMLNMLEEEYGAKLPAITDYRNNSKKQGAAQREWLEKAGTIEEMRRKLSKAEDAELSTLQKQATLAEIHPNLPFTDEKNAHLMGIEGAQEAYARLATMWRKLPEQAKKVYKAELEFNDKARDDQEAYVNRLITDTFTKQIDEAKQAGDDALVAKLEKQRADIISERGEALSRIRGPYFALSRRGDFIVVGKSDKYIAAEEKVDQADKAVRDILVAENPDQEALTAARKAARDARAELANLKGSESDYVVERHESEYRAKERKVELGKTMAKAYKLISNEFQREASGISEGALSAVRNAVAKNFDPKVASQMSDLLERLMLENLPDASIKKRDMKRIGVAGAEEDMGLAFRRQAYRTAFALARLKHAPDVNKALVNLRDQAKTSANEVDDEVYNTILNNHIASMEYKETPIQNAAVAMSYVYHLAWSPAFLLQNALQNPVLTVPMLAAKFGMAKSMKTWAQAAGQATKHMSSSVDNGVIHFRLDVDSMTKDVGERKMLDYLLDRGLIDITIDNEMDLTGNPIAQKARQAMRWAAYPASWMEVVNRSSAAITAYRLAREQGMKQEEATKYAERVVNDTHIDYSSENAPYLMRAGAIPLGKMFFQFRKFQLGMLYQMVRNFRGAVKGDKEAGKVLLNTLVMQQVIAGAAGFPLAAPIGFIANLVAKMFSEGDEPPDMEVWWRNFWSDMLGDDLGRVFTKGLPTLANIDLSGSVGLGNTFSLFPYTKDKQSLRDQGLEYMLNFFGPAGALSADALDGFDLVMKGDVQKGVEKLLPKVARNVIKAERIATEGITTRSGNELMSAEELGPLSVFASAAGISLADVNDMYLAKQFVEKQKRAKAEVRGRLIDDMIAAKKSGEDLSSVQEDIAAFNERHPQDKITMSTILKSEQAKKQYQKELVEGVRVGKREQNLKSDLRFAGPQGFADGGEVRADAGQGVAPYGFRHIESTDEVALPKGKGYYGALPNRNGAVSTEISASDDSGSFPLLTPNLSAAEVQHLLDGNEPTEEIFRKAREHAEARRSEGQDPFASQFGIRYPVK